jgi:molecular chaperone GrpE
LTPDPTKHRPSHDAARDGGTARGHAAAGTPAGGLPDAPSGAPPGTAEAELRAAREELEQLRDRWLRAAAELENYRRRTQREREEWSERRTAEVFEALLPVRDDFERALAHAPDDAQDAVLSGIRLVYRHLVEFCERFGVSPFEAEGRPFDPHLHEAILQVPRDDVPPDTVVEVALPGYLLGERVLRHARVVVSAAAAEEA